MRSGLKLVLIIVSLGIVAVMYWYAQNSMPGASSSSSSLGSATDQVPAVLALTPWEACRIGRADALKYYLENGQDPNEADERGTLMLEIGIDRHHPAIVQLLLEAGVDPNRSYSAGNNTPLHMAALAGNIEVVRVLLAGGADPLAENDETWRPRNMALPVGQLEIAQLLAEAEREAGG